MQSVLHLIKPRLRIHLSLKENTLVTIRIELGSSLQNIKVKNSKAYCEFIANVSARLKKNHLACLVALRMVVLKVTLSSPQ